MFAEKIEILVENWTIAPTFTVWCFVNYKSGKCGIIYWEKSPNYGTVSARKMLQMFLELAEPAGHFSFWWPVDWMHRIIAIAVNCRKLRKSSIRHWQKIYNSRTIGAIKSYICFWNWQNHPDTFPFGGQLIECIVKLQITVNCCKSSSNTLLCRLCL